MWSLAGATATWQCPQLQATVDLRRPDQGLVNLVFRDQPLGSASLMQMRLGAQEAADGLQLDDCYVRGRDLVASYTDTTRRVLLPVIYWCLGSADGPSAAEAVTIEMLVSTRTELLDSDPLVHVRCQVPAAVCRVCEDVELDLFQQMFWSSGDCVDLACGCRGCALAFELEPTPLVFGEVVSGSDIVRVQLSREPRLASIVSTVSLFGGRLEKGVIRRARLCGVLARPDQASSILQRQWHEMLLAPPPLTS